jgi:2-keto-4-pentenoate hydratase/2-oxohepta-3-ene-1,7-dioic acid hydratase in catechol pathway/sugar lactone lactonase YvrE
MRVRRVRLVGGGTSVALWHGERWVPLVPALERGGGAAELRRAALDVVALLGGGPELLERAIEAAQRLAGEDVDALVTPRQLLPFAPLSYRDCSLWPGHWEAAARGVARRFLPPGRYRAVEAYERLARRPLPRLAPPPLAAERPISYRGNHLTFLPDGATVPWPSYTQALDYELELGVVLSRPIRDPAPADALAAIGGFVVICDWSARDVQLAEISGPFGPAKSKDFGTSMGAVVVTPDEVEIEGLTGTVAVNGETWSRGGTAGMAHSLADVIAYAALGERLLPGELLALGTLPGCSGVELDRWLSPGDRVDLVIDRVGSLGATVGAPEPAAAAGPLGRARWNVVPRRGIGPEVPAVQPAAWTPPPALALPADTRLDRVERWELPGGSKPEDVLVDGRGRVYTGVEDGRIYRFEPDGTARLVADTHGRPLGLELDAQGRLVVCDAYRGLLRVTAGTVEVLADGLRFANNAAVAADGRIYFSDSSTRFDIEHYVLDLLEHRPNGRLLVHTPAGETRALRAGLYFPNGVALAPDDSFLLVAETWRYQVRRYWLTGPRAGSDEVVLNRLPGFPDNLSARGDGTYWVALANPRNPLVDRLLPRPAARRAVAALPEGLRPQEVRASSVLRIDGEGRILDVLSGTGRYAEVTGVREHGGRLYLGSLAESAIAHVPL